MTTAKRRTLAAVLVGLLAATSGVAAAAGPVTEQRATEAVATPEADVPAATTVADDENGTTIRTDGGELVLDAAPNRTIRGETDLEPGTNLTVRIEGRTFLQTTTSTVTDRRTFDATVDLGQISEQNVTVTVARGGTVLTRTEGRVVCDADCEATNGTTVENHALRPAVEAVTEVTQGKNASVDVLFGDADALTVTIGGPEVNYVVTGTVRDRDDDGRATVLFDTSRAGDDAPTLGVIDDGERRVVEASEETSLDSPLAPGTYDVAVANASGGSEVQGRLVVFESGPGPTGAADGQANTSIVTDGGELVLDAAPNQTIRGKTSVEPGTNLSLMIEGETFLRTKVVAVTEDGTFGTSVDLSDVAGEDLEITVSLDGTELATADGRVTCPDGCEPSTTTTVVTTDDDGDATPPNTSGSDGRLLGGVGMIALGGVLAVAGIGVLLGVFRR